MGTYLNCRRRKQDVKDCRPHCEYSLRSWGNTKDPVCFFPKIKYMNKRIPKETRKNDYNNTVVSTTRRDEMEPVKKKTKIFCQPAGYRNETMTDAKSIAVEHGKSGKTKIKERTATVEEKGGARPVNPK